MLFRSAGTGNPIANALVRIDLYSGAQLFQRSKSDGTFRFNTVAETWPPPDLPPGSPFFIYTARTHSVTVTEDSGFYLPNSQPINSLLRNQTLDLDIRLTPQGQL